jgi:uncharacterized membrane protein YdfJ with MMPL/SSD domain
MVAKTHEMVDATKELRDHIADFDDFFRHIRSFFYWERHCFDIPVCWSLRAVLTRWTESTWSPTNWTRSLATLTVWIS